MFKSTPESRIEAREEAAWLGAWLRVKKTQFQEMIMSGHWIGTVLSLGVFLTVLFLIGTLER